MPDAAATSPLDSEEHPLVSRRAVLKRSGLLVGGVGAGAFLAGCAGAPAPRWTYPVANGASGASPSASSPPAEPSGTTPASASPTATGSLPSPAAPSPSASAATARDPSPTDFAVPPPYRPKRNTPVVFDLESFDGPGQAIRIASDRTYQSMNFAGQVPAPTLRVTEGDTIRFTLTNRGTIPHSIDFHAAQTAWSRNYQTVAPGASFTFDWTADYPGVFMYHCGAPPVIMHIADGMFGAVIVDPKDGRPPAREYLFVQSEFYGSGGDYQAMLNKPPDVVAFNGQAFRHRATPLPVSASELLRIFIVNAGPNATSAFHVIGALFSRYEAEGNPANVRGMHQTINVPPGDGALVELTFAEPGKYPFVTHKFNDAEKGAVGLFDVGS
jgi:nitrite reductase (NO-forming)